PSIVRNVRSLGGTVLAEVGRLEEADHQLSLTVESFRGEHQSGVWLAGALDPLSDVARRRSQIARGVELGREAVAILEKSSASKHPSAALARVHLGAALWSSGQIAEGERLLRVG